ncbi:hypothetical protein RIB2604_03102310 [Aspergillus luchuensis]|uniref:Uncharacterized protein n=1 Tax=Aspergillus kawachii TaxID=1069201 RepID=A0A146FX71_ASPKA|nr:hypothetical protein RIB2604_03102310 [Aspergillus luchuensis]
MLSKIRNAASLKGGDPISSEIYLDLVTKTASEFSFMFYTIRRQAIIHAVVTELSPKVCGLPGQVYKAGLKASN